MAETCKLGEEVTNKMLGVGRGQKRIVKLGREGFESWPLNWKQSTCLVGVNLNPVPLLRDQIMYWGVSISIIVWVYQMFFDQQQNFGKPLGHQP